MNFLTDFIKTHAVGTNLTVTIVAQGLSLALNRATGIRRTAILKIGESNEATEAFIGSLLNKVQDGSLESMGEVASFVLGRHISK